jgi:hypothetical protein
MSPEIKFMNSAAGGVVVVVVSVLIFTLTLLWARRPAPSDRRVAVLAATGTSLLVILVSIMAVSFGWWAGDFFEISRAVLIAIYLPFSIAGYTLWLGIYRWLARRTRYAFGIYTLIVLVSIPVVTLVDPIQMQRGHFNLGAGYTIWTDALIGQIVMWSPVLFYEILRRRGIRWLE